MLVNNVHSTQYTPLLGYTEAHKFPEDYLLVFHCAHKLSVFGVRYWNQLIYKKFYNKQALSLIGDIGSKSTMLFCFDLLYFLI